MIMKRTIASILVILGFGSYALVEKTKTENNTPNKIKKDIAVTENDATSTSVTPAASAPKTTIVAPTVKKIRQEIVYSDDEYEEDDRPRVVTSGTPYSVNAQQPTPAVVQSVPTPTSASAPVTVITTQPASGGQYKNGSYTGDSVNVYYGDVQVKAIVSGGKLTAVDFLNYPQDRSRSLAIAERAMPVLIQEAISAQSSQVDVVSGATATSTGFIQSLASALVKAQ